MIPNPRFDHRTGLSSPGTLLLAAAGGAVVLFLFFLLPRLMSSPVAEARTLPLPEPSVDAERPAAARPGDEIVLDDAKTDAATAPTAESVVVVPPPASVAAIAGFAPEQNARAAAEYMARVPIKKSNEVRQFKAGKSGGGRSEISISELNAADKAKRKELRAQGLLPPANRAPREQSTANPSSKVDPQLSLREARKLARKKAAAAKAGGTGG